MDPGDKFTKYLQITNRLGEKMDFKIEIEDFMGSYDPDTTVRLLGGEKSPFSLKDYIHPEISEFTLKQGQRITLPVEISIPENMEAGGLYGAVLVSAHLPSAGPGGEEGKTKSQVEIISRLGTLFFIRIRGNVLEEGSLKDIITSKKFYEKGPVPMEILFENKGNVHLNPYGIIEIRNLFGKKIDEIKLDPWFAMPDSLRSRKVSWERNLLFGFYTATAKINRGYKDIIDQKSIKFWVIPWKIVLIGFGALFAVIWFFVWIFSHFEFKRKKPKSPGAKTAGLPPAEE